VERALEEGCLTRLGTLRPRGPTPTRIYPPLAVDRRDLRAQLHIGAARADEWPLAARVEPARGEAQRSTHRRNAMDGSMGGHELQSLDVIEVISDANQALALFRISRSSRRARFSRRSRRSSPCSSAVNQSYFRPASVSLPHSTANEIFARRWW